MRFSVHSVRRRGRLIRALVVMLVSLATLPVVMATPAHAASSISISHVPPTVLTAGDNVVLTATFTYTCDPTQYCGDRKARLVWVDAKGVTRTLDRTNGQGASGTTYSGGTVVTVWPVTVPGADVGAPVFRYHFEAEMESVGIAGSGGGSTFYGRSPSTGDNVINVDNQLRLRFVYADGSAAPNVPVEIRGTARGTTWHTTTDVQGWMRFTIPRTSAWVTSLVSGEKQGSVLVWAFDGQAPSTSATAGNPVAINGRGRMVATQLNYGHPLIDAQPGLQDKSVRLLPITDKFFHVDDFSPAQQAAQRSTQTNSTCYDTYRDGGPNGTGQHYKECLNTWDVGDQLTPVGENMGGGIDTQGKYAYTNNARTGSTRGFSVAYGDWGEAKGETTADKTREVSHETEWLGPNDRHGFGILLKYEVQEYTACPYRSDGSLDYGRCKRYATVRAVDWGGGVIVTGASFFDKWDKACDPAAEAPCNDYTVPLAGTYETTLSASQGWSWSFMVSPSWNETADLHAKTTYGRSADTTKEVKLSFRLNATKTKAHQYIFVPDGAVSGRTPAESPELTYTAASDAELYNTLPEDPNVQVCTSCYQPPPLI